MLVFADTQEIGLYVFEHQFCIWCLCLVDELDEYVDTVLIFNQVMNARYSDLIGERVFFRLAVDCLHNILENMSPSCVLSNLY